MHKITTELVRNYDVICIEDLSANGMMSNHHLAKSVAGGSFGELRRQLEYKTQWYSKRAFVIDRFYPSSQLCSCCGYRNPEAKNLDLRSCVCPECGVSLGRAINAASNILNEGLRLLA